MWLLRPLLVSAAPALAMLPPLMFSCGENSSNCQFEDVSGAWEASGVSIVTNSPGCPVLVQHSGDTVDFDATVTMPSTELLFNDDGFVTSYIQGTIYNGRNDTVQYMYNVFVDELNGSAECEPSGEYAVGTDSAKQDYADLFLYDSSGIGTTGDEGIVSLPFKIGTDAHVQGPSAVFVGVNNTWTGSATNGTTPYTYKWLRNDTLQSGQTGSTYSTSVRKVGSVRVSAVVTDARNRTDTSTDTVNVSFQASISGATQIASPGGSCTWSAQVSGGVPPVSYSWTWDGKGAGTAGSINEYLSTSPHTIGLSVQDGAGNASSQNLTVTIARSGGTACTQ